ncbi:MAG: hypothetical protein M3Z36_14415 [Acidobacteriota bacterium]|nr:hypothetical protein [Acidobacteriota bacterium]
MKQEQRSLEQIRAFLEGSEEIQFEAVHQGEVYRWVEEPRAGDAPDRALL